MHLAAENYVDRSIDNAVAFIETNIVGTYTLLEVARGYWNTLSEERKLVFRFVHISTDEVYGNLGENQSPFKEDSLYLPSGLDSASKPQVII